MNKVLAIGGFLIIIISIFSFWRTIEKRDVLLKGKNIEVTIFDVPRTCKESQRYAKAYFRFEYNNETHSKNFKRKYCEIIQRGAGIKLKTNEDNSIFVFPDENVNTNFIYVSIFLLLGLVCGFKGLKTHNSTLKTKK